MPQPTPTNGVLLLSRRLQNGWRQNQMFHHPQQTTQSFKEATRLKSWAAGSHSSSECHRGSTWRTEQIWRTAHAVGMETSVCKFWRGDQTSEDSEGMVRCGSLNTCFRNTSALADPRGCQGRPQGSNFFYFNAGFRKKNQIIAFHAHLRSGASTLGKSWTRCSGSIWVWVWVCTAEW